MPGFQYTARSMTGERLKGKVDAEDRRAAMQQLERKGLMPISVRESSEPVKKTKKKIGAAGKTKKKVNFQSGLKKRRARMKMRDVLMFTGELSDLLNSGMKLNTALNSLAKRECGDAQMEILGNIRESIVQGASMSDALAQWPETFSTLYVSMVRAGEASGSLSEVLERLREHYERVSEAREKVISALIYPAIIMILGVVTMIVVMVFVVPRFTTIFEELNATLPAATRVLIAISGFMGSIWGVLLAVGIIVGIVMFRSYIKTEPGARNWDTFKLRVPVVRDVISANAFAHFARTLAALMRNGVPVLKALAIVENTVGNIVIADEISEARKRVTDGSSISGPLASGQVFPPLLTDMLAIGEQTGDMPGALEHIAIRYSKELDRTVKVMTTVLEPIIMVFMALMVGGVAISMLMAVFDMTSGLGV